MALLDFSTKPKTKSTTLVNAGNTSTFKPFENLLNFSTNSTTSSFTDQTQNYYSNQQSSNVTNLFAINSNGVSADGKINPSMNTSPTTENKTEGGNAGINANTIIVAVVVIVALYFGITYLDAQNPTNLVKPKDKPKNKEEKT